MSILSFFGCGKKAPEYPADTLTTRDGTQITITFFRHASLSVEAGGKYIYVDPVSGYADYAALPKADVVLITRTTTTWTWRPSKRSRPRRPRYSATAHRPRRSK